MTLLYNLFKIAIIAFIITFLNFLFVFADVKFFGYLIIFAPILILIYIIKKHK